MSDIGGMAKGAAKGAAASAKLMAESLKEKAKGNPPDAESGKKTSGM